MITDHLNIDAVEFAAGTGWEIKPEGACKGDLCVPLGLGMFDAAVAAERLGMAVVHNPDMGLWALGPESLTGRALLAAQAPELTLSELNGNTFRLSSLRGQKVVLVAWAPY